MPDVLKIAQDRRASLLKEVAALDRFIEMAHALLAGAAANDSTTGSAKPAATLKPAPIPTASTMKPAPGSQTEAFLQDHEAKPNRPSMVVKKVGT